MTHVDGYLLAVPSTERERYREHAQHLADLARAEGALQVIEAWGGELSASRRSAFGRAVDIRDGETIVFSWVVWPSKDHRDAALARLRADPRMQAAMQDLPVDPARIVMGGFETFVQA